MNLNKFIKQPEDIKYSEWASHDSLFLACKNCGKTFGQPYIAQEGAIAKEICDKCDEELTEDMVRSRFDFG